MQCHAKEVTLPSLPDPHRFPTTPHPTTPTPHGHHLSSALRSSLDTPLSVYAANRHRLTLSHHSRAHTVQVPLNALSSPKAQPGAVGGSFNATTRVKYVPLPAIYNSLQVTKRGVRNVRLHVNRYLPITGRPRTHSDSLLAVPQAEHRLKEHLLERDTNLKKSRSLKRASEVIPHRIERAFYMSGHSAQLFDKQEIPPEELQALQEATLAQNADLFYGKGFKPAGAVRSRQVQKYETKLKELAEMNRSFGWEELSLDAGRYSRASRASRMVTPAPPIPEERTENEVGRTFVTESGSKHRTGTDATMGHQ